MSNWRKSSYSMPTGECVEAGQEPGIVGVRDTQLGEKSPVLEFSAGAWTRFLSAIKG